MVAMETLILFTILITFQTPDWQSEDGIYYKELDNQFTLVQYIPNTGYVFSKEIKEVTLLNCMDVLNELAFLGTPSRKVGGVDKGFLYMEWRHEYKFVFFFNEYRFRLEITK